VAWKRRQYENVDDESFFRTYLSLLLSLSWDELANHILINAGTKIAPPPQCAYHASGERCCCLDVHVSNELTDVISNNQTILKDYSTSAFLVL